MLRVQNSAQCQPLPMLYFYFFPQKYGPVHLHGTVHFTEQKTQGLVLIGGRSQATFPCFSHHTKPA